MNGMATPGTLRPFPTEGSSRTGAGGMTIGIGKGGGIGASRTMNLDQNEREMNFDAKGNGNITRGLRFNGMRKKDGAESIGGKG